MEARDRWGTRGWMLFCILLTPPTLAGTPPPAAETAPTALVGMTDQSREHLQSLTLQLQSDSEAEINDALGELRRLAAGEPSFEKTREAMFLLATWLPLRDGDTDPRAIRAMSSATTLYPQDPRALSILERLGLAHDALGNRIEAHLALGRVVAEEGDRTTPSTLVRAAYNAAAIGDLPASFEWSSALNLAALDEEERGMALIAQLVGAHGTGRYDLAADAIAWLDRDMPETLRVHEQALFAAALVDESLGKLESAIARYRLYANIHSRAAQRPAALWAMARHLDQLTRAAEASKVLAWLVTDHPESDESAEARILLLETLGEPPDPSLIAAYVVMARDAPTARSVNLICERMVSRFIGAGYPIEAISALGRLAREDAESSLAPIAARSSFRRALEPAIGLLESRDDYLGIAAVAAEAESLGLPVPQSRQLAVSDARARLGLPPQGAGLVYDAIQQATAAAERAHWPQVITTLEEIVAIDRDPEPRNLLRVTRLLGEALWREGRGSEALPLIDRALGDERLLAEEHRKLRVLRADIVFSAGGIGEACADYKTAGAVFASEWVDQQLERCRVWKRENQEDA